MAKNSRALSANASAMPEPIGGRFYTRQRTAVSGAFIKSLRSDGVSRDTIRAIEKDNAKLARTTASRSRGDGAAHRA